MKSARCSSQSRPLLRLAAALTLAEVRRALVELIPGEIHCRSLFLGLGIGLTRPPIVFGHGDRSLNLDFATVAQQVGSAGRPVQRLAAELPGRFLGIFAWRDRRPQAAFVLGRAGDEPDFSARDIRNAEALQPHLQVALRRVLSHEERTLRAEQLSALLEYVPIGLLLIDWDMQVLWRNNEAANCCAFWNHGERGAPAVRARRAFRIPPAIIRACVRLRARWEREAAQGNGGQGKLRADVHDSQALHAQLTVHSNANNPFLRPVFRIHLDYRRPRGDREKQISEGAVALLARLSGREREVAMWLREGLRNADIAAEMRVSPATIKAQLSSIYAKLDVAGRARAAALLNR
jgi:DNA-binding CsgD family transcriptional regulator